MVRRAGPAITDRQRQTKNGEARLNFSRCHGKAPPADREFDQRQLLRDACAASASSQSRKATSRGRPAHPGR